MFQVTKRNREEINSLLKKKRELIKNNPEYYGSWTPSKMKDYINYKNFLLEWLIK